MEFKAYISDHEDPLYAIDALIGQASLDMDGRPDVVFAFFTGDHLQQIRRCASRLHEQLEPQCLIGCSAEGVIGFDREIERTPGVALLVGRLPNVRLHAFHVPRNDWPDLMADRDLLTERLAIGEETRAVLTLPDPFTTPIGSVLTEFDEAFPGLPIIGGMASAARRPGENVLILDDEAHDEGMVGISFAGPVDVQTVVSQGCRPIGPTYVITKGRDNIIEQLGGRSALHALRETVHSLPAGEQDLFQNGLFIGRAISEYRERFGRGDFLVRNVIGIDQEQGVIALADHIRVGQTVQFHVRDAATATEDLRLMLTGQGGLPPAAGALLFSCNGRGTRMFDAPCHDIGVAAESLPQTPIAGFFAAGELGPVGGRNFIHGHTASLALFRPKEGV
jgi:small ligand-binding sensory domain FIST